MDMTYWRVLRNALTSSLTSSLGKTFPPDALPETTPTPEALEDLGAGAGAAALTGAGAGEGTAFLASSAFLAAADERRKKDR